MKLALRAITGFDTRCGQENKFDFFLQRIDEVVAAALEIPWPLPEEVRHTDDVLLATEARDLLGPPPCPWRRLPPPLPQIVRPWMPEEVHAQFMRIYQETRTMTMSNENRELWLAKRRKGIGGSTPPNAPACPAGQRPWRFTSPRRAKPTATKRPKCGAARS